MEIKNRRIKCLFPPTPNIIIKNKSKLNEEIEKKVTENSIANIIFHSNRLTIRKNFNQYFDHLIDCLQKFKWMIEKKMQNLVEISMEIAKWIKMIVDVVNNITLITNDPNFNMEIAKRVIQISSYSAHLLNDFYDIYTHQLNTLNNYNNNNNNNNNIHKNDDDNINNNTNNDDDDNDEDNIRVDNSRYDHLLNLISNFQSFLFLFNHKNNSNNKI